MTLQDDPNIKARSALRRVHEPAPRRRRNYLFRWVITLCLLGGLGYVMAAIALEWWPKNGAARPLYRFHDEVWLWLRGTVWTAIFPYALIWAVPGCVVLGILMTEYLSPLGIARRHRGAILFVARVASTFSRVANLFGAKKDVTHASWLRAEDWRAARANNEISVARGYALRVLQEARLKAWHQAVQYSGKRGTLRRLAALDGHLLRLSPSDPRVLLHAIETVSFDVDGRVTAHVMRDVAARCGALAADGPDDIAADALALGRLLQDPPPNDTAILAELHRVENRSAADDAAPPSPVALATLYLAITRNPAPRDGLALRAFLDTWTLLRARTGPIQAPLAMAEGMVDAVFWTTLADSRVVTTDDPGQKDGFLDRFLPGIDMADGVGELVLPGLNGPAR